MKNDTVVLNKTKKEAKIYEKSMVFRRSTTLKVKNFIIMTGILPLANTVCLRALWIIK